MNKSNPNNYQICNRCVMDTSHSEIEFDSEGICNFCHGYDVIHLQRPPGDQLNRLLDQKLRAIKEDGKNRDYDCILGVSGGVDSSYLALKCKDWGLRPLLIQFDNGWNSELANHNIQSICETLGFDLKTYVVDWSEFRDLQMAFLRAGVANIEGVSDHGIAACVYGTAIKAKVPWVLSGVNYATEACNPLGEKAKYNFGYGYRYSDLVQLRAIHRRFGRRKLKTFPTMGFFRKLFLEKTRRIKIFDPLNYLDYNKESAIKELQERAGWRPYPGKHFESIITRFHQSYILPVKFGMDKRRLHLSGLIWSGQITREQANETLLQPSCPALLLKQDLEFFLKKMELTPGQFDEMMAAPPKVYSDYPNINWLYIAYPKIITAIRKVLPSRRNAVSIGGLFALFGMPR